MFYEHEDNIYAEVGGEVFPVNITAKDKVVEHRELESVTSEVVGGAVKLPLQAQPMTLDEIVAKYAVSEKNPLMFKGATKKASKKSDSE